MKIALSSQPVDVRHKLPPLRALTAIRFFAAIHVVLAHEAHWPNHIVFFPLAARVVASGYTAVTLFFVLSGFILAYNYERVRSRRQFWISRFARIYPVYLLSLLPPLLITPHWSYHPHPGAVGVALTFLLLQAWWPPLCFSLNMAAWTLSVEAFFYAAFPWLLPWVQRLRRPVFLSIQAAYLVLLCLPPLLALHATTAPTALQLGRWLESSLPIVRLNAFVLGIYAGVHFRRWATHRLSLDAPPSASPISWTILPVAAAILALLVAAPSDPYLPLRTGLLQISYAALIWLLAGVEWAVLNNHVMQMAGEISYSIYILQFPVMFALDDLLGRLFPRAGHISQLYIPVLIAVAYAVFRWFEIPARLAIRSRLTGHPVPVRPI